MASLNSQSKICQRKAVRKYTFCLATGGCHGVSFSCPVAAAKLQHALQHTSTRVPLCLPFLIKSMSRWLLCAPHGVFLLLSQLMHAVERCKHAAKYKLVQSEITITFWLQWLWLNYVFEALVYLSFQPDHHSFQRCKAPRRPTVTPRSRWDRGFGTAGTCWGSDPRTACSPLGGRLCRQTERKCTISSR